jgi:hypothetical protein
MTTTMTVEDTPGGGAVVYDEQQHVVVRCTGVMVRVDGTAGRTKLDQVWLDFPRPVSAGEMVGVLEALRTHEPKWVE